jgi:NADP-dependent 3-hydroxy acid dehydrogenase YdfG
VIDTMRHADLAAEFEQLAPGRSTALVLDVSDERAISVRVPAAVARACGVDVLVNNAGYSLIGAVEETSVREARESWPSTSSAPCW